MLITQSITLSVKITKSEILFMKSLIGFDCRDECRRLTIVNIVNPARFKRFPRSRTSVNGEMCGLIPC